MFNTNHKVLVITGLVLYLFSSVFAYSGGSGEPNDPYRIATKADLLELAAATADYNECFILTADIDMEGQVFTTAIIAADTSWSDGFQGTPFTGTFDGAGHKITNFSIDGGSNHYLGLFGKIDSGGLVKNLGLENCAVSGYRYVGGLVGRNGGGSISNCYSTGAVSGFRYVGGLVGYNSGSSISNCYSTGAVSGSSYYIGGLVGYNYSGSISDCYATGAVTGFSYVGGLVGYNYYGGNISNCYSTGTVSGSLGSHGSVGGLVGDNEGGSISNCYSTGAVSGNSDCVGGLVGNNHEGGSISNCYSTGTVSGFNRVGGLVGKNYEGAITACYAVGTVTVTQSSVYSVGGLVGYNYGGSISDCYSTGAVSGFNRVGGLVGRNYDGSISDCYATGAVTGFSYVGGLVGYNISDSVISSSFWDVNSSGWIDGVGNMDPDPNGVVGLTTSQMQDMDTFVNAGWDFDYTDGSPADWFIQIDEYPILTWQISPADIYTDGRDNMRDFAVFAQYWMREDCAIYNYYCDWADMDFNGSVDIDDLIVLMSYWLEEGIYNH